MNRMVYLHDLGSAGTAGMIFAIIRKLTRPAP
jgi:hypothetical protein